MSAQCGEEKRFQLAYFKAKRHWEGKSIRLNLKVLDSAGWSRCKFWTFPTLKKIASVQGRF
jgi:hypothetical protein